MGAGPRKVGEGYKVVAFYALLTLLLAPSCKPVNPKPDLTAPSGLTAFAVTTTRIDLAWVSLATDATLVEIERSLDGVTFALIATVPDTQLTYSDTGLSPSTRYYYRLRAAGPSGVGPYTAVVAANTVIVAPLPAAAGPAPSARMDHSTTYVSGTQRMYVFGGRLVGGAGTDELWVLDLSVVPAVWTDLTLSAGGIPPTPRFGHSAVYDSTFDRIIFFGGWDGSLGGETDEVYSLELSGSGPGPYPFWSPLPILGGASPFPRRGHAAIFDASFQRMIVFGGGDFTGPSIDPTWELTLPVPAATPPFPTWTEITAPGPSLRSGASAIYDGGAVNRMIIFGGEDSSLGTTSNEVWELTLPAAVGSAGWTPIIAPGGPTARFGHGAVLNGSKMMIFGGLAGSASGEAWELDLGAPPAWVPVTLGLPAPGARLGHGLIFRPTPSRMVLFAGGTDPMTPFFSDLWEFGL